MGNVYVVGSTNGDLGGKMMSGLKDCFVTKYNSAGKIQWTELLGAAGASTNGGGILIDRNDNIYITGSTGGSLLDGNKPTGHFDFFITKYNSLGVRQ